MKLGYFIGGSSALLMGWLALTFVSPTSPVNGSKSVRPGAAENHRTVPSEAGTPAPASGRIFPISLSQ